MGSRAFSAALLVGSFVFIAVGFLVLGEFGDFQQSKLADQLKAQDPLGALQETAPTTLPNRPLASASALPSSAEPNGEGGGFVPPVPGFPEEITKKPFGIFINPETSPVQPERFRGYHTGVDVEVVDVDASNPWWRLRPEKWFFPDLSRVMAGLLGLHMNWAVSPMWRCMVISIPKGCWRQADT
jgi:hypothetical protein